MIVSPKLGWRISRQAMTRRAAAASSGTHRQRLVLLLQRQHPGDGDDEERLQEFGRLELREAARRASAAPRSPRCRSIGTSEQRERTEPRRAGERSRRAPSAWSIETPIITGMASAIHIELTGRNNKAAGPSTPSARQALAGGGRARRRPRSARWRSAPRPGSRGPCRSPRTISRAELRVETAVARRLAGPLAARRSSLPCMLIKSASHRGAGTRRPRTSKSRNWSNDAQAGDSSTTGSPGRRRRGTARAGCVAASSVPDMLIRHLPFERARRTPAPPRRSDRPCAMRGKNRLSAGRCRRPSACRRRSSRCRSNEASACAAESALVRLRSR